MATDYRDMYSYEGTLDQAITTAASRSEGRFRFYASDGRGGITDGSDFLGRDGIYGYYTDAYTPLAANPDVSRSFFLTLDNNLNPQHFIGEEGIFFSTIRDGLVYDACDYDLLLINNDSGARANWPKLWWDYSELAFTFGETGNTVKLYVENFLYVSGTQGIGIKTLTDLALTGVEKNLLEIWDDNAHPVLSITAVHATDFDPMIAFLTDASPTVKSTIGVDSATNHFKVNVGAPSAGIGDSTQFVFTDTGRLGIGIEEPDCMLHIYKGAAAASSNATAALTIEDNEGVSLQFLVPDGSYSLILFGDASDNDIGLIQYDHNGNGLTIWVNTACMLDLTDTGLVIGHGSNPSSAFIEAYGTTEQLRLSYDVTHYCSFTVDAVGDLAINAVGTEGNTITLSNETIISSTCRVNGTLYVEDYIRAKDASGLQVLADGGELAAYFTDAASVAIGPAGALTTNAKDGFLYIPSCAGMPIGEPTDIGNKSAIVHDTTNNRIYLYDHVSNAWQYAALT